jgi:hypothetical protein
MKFNPVSTLLLLIILTAAFSTVAFADASVGVKVGDWVEYNVSFTGTPPPEHDVHWARMDVTVVEGQRVNATFTSQLANGTMLSVAEDIDFSTGRLIDMFIIPVGLNTGDTFYAQGVGNITVDDIYAREAAGAVRSLVHASAVDTEWYWDKATGVVVEARTTNAVYTLDTVATSTNLWGTQILGLDQLVFYALVVLIVVVIAVSVIALVVQRRKRMRQIRRENP